MPEPKTATLEEIHSAVNELRTEVEKKSVDQEKIDKINTFLDEQEDLNQKSLIARNDLESKNSDFLERIESMEVELARKVATGEEKSYRDAPEYKALQELLTKGEIRIETEQKALLRTDNDTAGGYLVTGEMDNVITKQITEISGIRSIARVRTISSKSLEMPIRKTIPTATYEGEAEIGDESASSYGSETVTAFRLTHTVPITQDMLMDSSFNMEAEIFSDSAEAFAYKEGNKFVLGTGSKQPEGFLVNADVIANQFTSAASGVVDHTDMINLAGELKVGYTGTYVFNRKTLAALRVLKSTTGSFIWLPGVNGVAMNTYAGFEYIIAQDMPDITNSSLSVAFGDFRRGYTIIDRTGISIIRDDVTRKKAAIVEFTIHRYNNGMVTLPEAIKVMKTKA